MKEDPRHIHISEYSYPLLDERIAKFPLPTRDQSKLLIYRRGEVSEDVFTSLPEYLPQLQPPYALRYCRVLFSSALQTESNSF